jgi:uncharacterized protein with ACT and thioredoxin-like domain
MIGSVEDVATPTVSDVLAAGAVGTASLSVEDFFHIDRKSLLRWECPSHNGSAPPEFQ